MDQANTFHYFRHHQGHWQGRYHFSICNWSVFWQARLSLMERLQLLSLALLPFLSLKTQVEAEKAGAVVHRTWLEIAGICCFKSVETLYLHPDGRNLHSKQVQQLWPGFKSLPETTGTGWILPDGTGMVYDWHWYDRRMKQRSRILPDGLELQQSSDYSHAHVILQRTPAPQPAQGQQAPQEG